MAARPSTEQQWKKSETAELLRRYSEEAARIEAERRAK